MNFDFMFGFFVGLFFGTMILGCRERRRNQRKKIRIMEGLC